MAKTFFDNVSGTVDEIVKQIRHLVEEGNARRMIVKNKKGKTLLEVPLSIGLAGSTIAGIMAPVISGLAMFAFFINDINVLVERYPDTEEAAMEAEVVDIETEESEAEDEKKTKASDDDEQEIPIEDEDESK